MSEPSDAKGGHRSLEGRTALVTGASRGIGRATALRLARAGARVGLVARSRDVLEALAEETGGWALHGDLSRPEEVEGILARFGEEAGTPPDLVVTAAGVFTLSPTHRFSPGELDDSLSVNLKGTLLVVRGILPAMLERGSGTLVLVGSVAGRKALPGNAVYSAAKFGVRGFHEVLLEELRGTGVRATLLEPAATDTPLWDSLEPDRDPRLPNRAAMLRPEELAEAVVWVASRPESVQVPFLPMESC
jgi:NADP-dependent 3-hydroxy acid dehydrogenase YdfG